MLRRKKSTVLFHFASTNIGFWQIIAAGIPIQEHSSKNLLSDTTDRAPSRRLASKAVMEIGMNVRLLTAAGALALGLGLASTASAQMQPGMGGGQMGGDQMQQGGMDRGGMQQGGMRKGMHSKKMSKKGMMRNKRMMKRQGSM